MEMIKEINESSRTKKWEIEFLVWKKCVTVMMISWFVHDYDAWENYKNSQVNSQASNVCWLFSCEYLRICLSLLSALNFDSYFERHATASMSVSSLVPAQSILFTAYISFESDLELLWLRLLPSAFHQNIQINSVVKNERQNVPQAIWFQLAPRRIRRLFVSCKWPELQSSPSHFSRWKEFFHISSS